MALPHLLTVLMAVAMATGANSDSKENELGYGFWNYREGADSVNVASVPSVTRVLDAWGKRIFNQIKTALHSEPSTLLPDYSRVRHLSESLNDLFREASLLRMRITELSQRLTTMEPLLRHYGYREQRGGRPAGGGWVTDRTRITDPGVRVHRGGGRLVKKGPARPGGETQ